MREHFGNISSFPGHLPGVDGFQGDVIRRPATTAGIEQATLGEAPASIPGFLPGREDSPCSEPAKLALPILQGARVAIVHRDRRK